MRSVKVVAYRSIKLDYTIRKTASKGYGRSKVERKVCKMNIGSRSDGAYGKKIKKLE